MLLNLLNCKIMHKTFIHSTNASLPLLGELKGAFVSAKQGHYTVKITKK